jgi:ubiquinone/menaquinone biosynthesis C-methylase UbiE
MAETYDKLVPYLVPKYDFLQEEAIRLLDFNQDSELSIIDLGAGTGIFLEKILKKFSNAKCYYIDFSNDFKKVAQSRE